MTNRLKEATARPPVQHPTTAGADGHGPVRRAALVAGIGLLLMAALAAFGNLVVVEGLVTPGNPTKTAGDILASEGLFRLGVASLYLVVILDVVVAWALLRVLSPVSRSVSTLAAWFRLAYAGIFVVAVSQLAGIPDLLESKDHSSAITTEQLPARATLKLDAFDDVWMAGLILFGIHLVLVGYLAYKSGYVPRTLGVLLVIAGVGYAFDSIVTVLAADSPFKISTITFVGEFLFCLWLLIRGHRITLAPGQAGDPGRGRAT